MSERSDEVERYINHIKDYTDYKINTLMKDNTGADVRSLLLNDPLLKGMQDAITAIMSSSVDPLPFLIQKDGVRFKVSLEHDKINIVNVEDKDFYKQHVNVGTVGHIDHG